MGSLDRAALDALLGEATTPAAAATARVSLPNRGVDIHLRRRLTRTEEIKVASYARGRDAVDLEDDDDVADVEARATIAALRFALVDEEGELLLRSFREAAAFLEALDHSDFVAIGVALGAREAPVVEDVETGKAPSSPSPPSTASTRWPTS